MESHNALGGHTLKQAWTARKAMNQAAPTQIMYRHVTGLCLADCWHTAAGFLQQPLVYDFTRGTYALKAHARGICSGLSSYVANCFLAVCIASISHNCRE